VARQLAMRTVIAWFGNLSYGQQKDALEQLQHEHEQSRSAKRTELETQLAALGFGVTKKRGRPRASANGGANGKVFAVGNGAALKKTRKGKVKAKYRDPKTKETWSGRGRMASWLKSKQDAGEKIDTYLA
jgi:DNA-binding protein H-NS